MDYNLFILFAKAPAEQENKVSHFCVKHIVLDAPINGIKICK